MLPSAQAQRVLQAKRDQAQKDRENARQNAEEREALEAKQKEKRDLRAREAKRVLAHRDGCIFTILDIVKGSLTEPTQRVAAG